MDWTTWKPASCLPDCWCEAARVGSFILEPVNTWTNLGFILTGIYFLLKASRFQHGNNTLGRDKHYPMLYGGALAFVGLGSFFFHMSQTFVGQWFDVFGMYLVSVYYICYNLLRIGKLQKKSFLISYFVICIILGLVIAYIPATRRILFGTSIGIALIQSIWIQMKVKSVINSKYLWLAVGSYLVAQTVWVLDKKRIVCDPYAWMNGHGVWHILTCVAAVSVYLYFNSEKDGLRNETVLSS